MNIDIVVIDVILTRVPLEEGELRESKHLGYVLLHLKATMTL